MAGKNLRIATPTGLINGVNATFTFKQSVGHNPIYLNGLLQKIGASADYVVGTEFTITFNVIPQTGDHILGIFVT